MNSTKRCAILGVVLGVASMGAESLLAQTAPAVPSPATGSAASGREFRKAHRRGQGMFQQLNLTPDQQKKVTELRQALKTKAEPVRTQLKAKRDELETLWQAPSPDRNAILAKTRELRALQDQMCESRVDFRLGMNSVLTPEQRDKMKQLRGKRGAGRGGRSRGRGCGQGLRRFGGNDGAGQ